MAQYDDLNTKQIWIVGAISAILTVITILAVQVLYYAMQTSHEESQLSRSEYTSSIQHIDAQLSELDSYGRDAETGAIHIPIDRAIDIFVNQPESSSEEI